MTERLLTVLKKINNCRSLLDVGCDHGYLAIAAVREKRAERVIASDVNKGPLASADENIKKAGLEGQIETRLGSGITVISPGEAETVVIAGMGGILISELLNENESVTRSVEKFILQPMNSLPDLRRKLIADGFTVTEETICRERERLYHILTVKNGREEPYSKEIFYYTGDLNRLTDTSREITEEFFRRTEEKFRRVLEGLKDASEGEERKKYYEKLLEELLWLRSEILKK